MIDCGYAWVIPFACFFIQGALFGSYRSYGLLYQVILDKFHVLRADASWPFSLCMTVIHLTGPISGCLNKYASVRVITFIGCCLASLGIALCYFALSVFHITLAIGLLQGFGIGLTYIQNSAIINEYFVKYRGTANGISLSGGTIGAFIISTALEHTLKEYPLKYSFLMLAAIITLTLPVSCLLREPRDKEQSIECADGERSERRSSRKLSSKQSGHPISTCTMSGDSNNTVLKNPDSFNSPCKVFAILGNNYWSIVPGSGREKRFSLCNDSKTSLEVSLVNRNSLASVFSIGKHHNNFSSESASNVSLIKYQSKGKTLLSNQSLDIDRPDLSQSVSEDESRLKTDAISSSCPPSAPSSPATSSLFLATEPIFIADPALLPTDKQFDRTCSRHDGNVIKDDSSVTLSYCSCDEVNSNNNHDTKLTRSLWDNVREIIKNPIFALIALTHASYFWSVITFTMVIVDYSLDAGIPKKSSVTLLNSFSIGDLVGRLASGVLLDSWNCKLKHISMFAITGIGGLMIATPALAQLHYSYQLLIVINISMGLLSGLINVLLNNLFCLYIGSDLAALAFGLSAFISGILTLARPSLVGYFRDRSGGSYDGLFISLGAASLITGIFWLFEPWIHSMGTHSHTKFDNDSRRTTVHSCHDRRDSAASCSSASSSGTSCCDRDCIHHKSNSSIGTEKTLVFPSEENVSQGTRTVVSQSNQLSTDKGKPGHLDQG